MKKTYRKCDTCKNEYRVTREAQSYCSPRCRRAAAYGRERFQSQTQGPRKRLLRLRETSDTRRPTASEPPSGRVDIHSTRTVPIKQRPGSSLVERSTRA